LKKKRLNDEKRTKQTEQTDEKTNARQQTRFPQDILLNIVSNFVSFSSIRVKELYKIINEPSLKVTELLDVKSHFKLIEIASTLLKMWDDSRSLKGQGLQKYFILMIAFNLKIP
jgi:hypothetical protein